MTGHLSGSCLVCLVSSWRSAKVLRQSTVGERLLHNSHLLKLMWSESELWSQCSFITVDLIILNVCKLLQNHAQCAILWWHYVKSLLSFFLPQDSIQNVTSLICSLQASATCIWTTRWHCCSAPGSFWCPSVLDGGHMSSVTAACCASPQTWSSTST